MCIRPGENYKKKKKRKKKGKEKKRKRRRREEYNKYIEVSKLNVL
jgi:hypothetical protein